MERFRGVYQHFPSCQLNKGSKVSKCAKNMYGVFMIINIYIYAPTHAETKFGGHIEYFSCSKNLQGKYKYFKDF